MERHHNHNHHPTLSRIDRALGGDHPQFATSPHADQLEPIARTLTDEYWGEHAWLTGNVPHAAFETVCRLLEAHRQRASRAPDALPTFRQRTPNTLSARRDHRPASPRPWAKVA